MTQNAVLFQGVNKYFGAVRAIDGLDLSIRTGEMVALLGANGAGKSTAVNLMLGLLAPDTGTVRVLGERPERVVAQGRIGVMLQDGGLMTGVGVRALVELVCGMYASPRPVEQVLAEAELTGICDRRVDRLSGGQTQRLRFAVAIAGNPQILVLDEPTTAMDVESRRAFWAVIRSYAGEGHTVLFATHYLQEADEFADRIVVLARGRVVTQGSPTQLKASAGARTIRFTLGEQPVAGLERLPGVTAVEVHGRTAALRTADTEATVRALFAARDRVPDLEVGGADLEDAVLALTHSSTQE
jgi:ABC-2 type transport system ATP-binding protein